MYVFNKITVNPQLPKNINRLQEIANNLWWSWNSEFLRLFKSIDNDLWETVDKNPVKFLKRVSQERIEIASNDDKFVKEYNKVVKNFDDYMTSKDTWFNKKIRRKAKFTFLLFGHLSFFIFSIISEVEVTFPRSTETPLI